MILEHIKTLILFFLVATSVFLTWQLWTFQPQYDYLERTELVSKEGLADQRELSQLIRPQKIVLHHQGTDTHKVSYPGGFAFNSIYDRMKKWSFHRFQEVRAHEYKQKQEQMHDSTGVEIKFGMDINGELWNEITSFPVETSDFPTFNRLWLYYAEEGDKVYAVFISEQEQHMVESVTTLTEKDLKEYLQLAGNSPDYESHVFGDTQYDEIYPVHYLPVDPTLVAEYAYFVQTIPLDLMSSYLFVDPTLVRQIEDREGTLYTDGSRALQNYHEHMTMHFFYPQAESPVVDDETQERTNVVQRATQFVNQHHGWDTIYVLENVEDGADDDQTKVHFRQYIRDKQIQYPIYPESQEQDQHLIRLEMQGDRVVGYYRPLVERDQEMRPKKEMQLPAGSSLVAYLEDEEIDMAGIKDIKIAYQSEITDNYIHFAPYWVVERNVGETLFIQSLSTDEGSMVE